MAPSQPNLRVRISADLNDIRQGMALMRADFAKFRQEAAKSVDLKGLNEGFSKLRNTVGGLFAGVTVGSVFKALIDETRDASNEVAQLQAVLTSTGQQAGFTARQLLDMADNLSDSTTHSTGEIVNAQTRLLSYTGIVGKQFPQALQMAIDQSARLGESIEQSAETIGKALDKPSQGVTALTKQGFKFTEQQKQQMKVMEASGRTAEAQQIVLDAMAESYAGAAAAARNTFGGALTAVGNSLKDLMDGSGGGGLHGATVAINEVARALGSPEVKGAFAEMADAVLRSAASFAQFIAQDGVRYLRGLADAVTLVVKNIDLLAVAVGTYFAAQAVPAAIAGVRGLIAWLTMMRNSLAASAIAANGLKATLATLGGPITLAIVALSTALYYLYQRTQDAKNAAIEHARVLQQINDLSKTARDRAYELAEAKRKEAFETYRAAKAHLEAERYRSQAVGFATTGGGPLGGGRVSLGETDPGVVKAKAAFDDAQKKLDDLDAAIFDVLTTGIDQILKPVTDTADAVGSALAKSNAMLVDAVRRSLADLERLYQENGISIEQYFSKRAALQQKSIDLEIDQARAELAITTEAAGRRRLEEQILKLQRDRAEVGTAAAHEQRKAEEGLAQSLAEVKGRLLDLDGKSGEAERQQLEAQYKSLLKRLRAEGDATGEALVQSLIGRLVAKAQSDELREAMSRITSQLQGKETSVGAQVDAGLMGYGEGERQLSDARAKALVELQQLRIASVQAMAGYAKGSPEHTAAVRGLQELDTNIAQIVSSQQVWGQKIQDFAASSFGDFLGDLTTGAKSFRQAFNDMVKGFISGVARMVAQEAALRTVSSLFPRVSASADSVGLFKHHTGGTVGSGGTPLRLPISPLVLGQAPRHHTGAAIGIKSDERLAVLQTGERVLSRRQTAAHDAAQRTGEGASGAVLGALRVEIQNKGAPARVESATIGRGNSGEQLLRVFLSAAADDLASGGMLAQAGVSRFDWQERV